jgi:YggT family protein
VLVAYRIVMGLLSVYQIILIARVILSWVVAFNRDWTPKGFLLVVSEFVYTVTDPPIKFLRRFIKPLKLGGMALDMSVIVLFFIIFLLGYAAQFAYLALSR